MSRMNRKMASARSSTVISGAAGETNVAAGAGSSASSPAEAPTQRQAMHPLDPAVVLAQAMLGRALGASQHKARAGQPGTLSLITLPDREWKQAVQDAWGKILYEEERPEREEDSWDPPSRHGWLAWTPSRAKWNFDEGSSVLDALWQGRPIAVFATKSDDEIDGDVQLSTDVQIEVGLPLPEDVAQVALRLTGQLPASTLSEEQAASVTPRLIHLAGRPGRSADEIIDCLRQLIMLRAGRILTGVPAAVDGSGASSLVPPAPPAKRRAPPRDAPSLDRLHGMAPAIAWARSLELALPLYDAGKLSWSDVDSALLLSGPPGCGKTLFARALAARIGVPLMTGSYASWLATGRGHQGDMLKAMRQCFADARAAGRAVVFLDEIDSFPNRAELKHDWKDWEIQVVNALLAEIDGADGRAGVVLLAACNHPHMLDPALVRSGRLDRHIQLSLPSSQEFALILREHLGADLQGADLSGVATLAAGASGADAERYVRGARRRAREAMREVLMPDLVAEIGGEDSRSDEERGRASMHEAGHAVACVVSMPGDLCFTTIRVAKGAGGETRSSRRQQTFRKDELRNQIVAFLAGRAAEEVILGSPSTGAGGSFDSDLASATAIAVDMMTAYGLDERTGLVWTGRHDADALARRLSIDPVLAEDVRSVLDECFREATKLVALHRTAVEAVAAKLLERTALSGAEVEALVEELALTSRCAGQ